MERENHIQNELTAQSGNAYSSGRGNFMQEGGEVPMSEPQKEAPRKSGASDKPESEIIQPGFFADSDIRNPHTRSTLELIKEAEEVPADQRKAAQVKLAEDMGLDLEESQRRIDQIREELPAGGTSDTRAQRNAPRGRIRLRRRGAGNQDGGNAANGPDGSPIRHTEETAEEKKNRILREKGFDEAYIDNQDEWELAARGYMFLTGYEVYQLTTDPGSWLEDKFNQLYDFANRGEEMNSPVVQQISSSFGDAAKLMAREHGALEPELVTRITSEFQTRQNLIFMRSMAEAGNMEALGSLAARVRGEGLFNALDYEQGQVAIAYARLLDLYDDVRLAHGGKNFKMTPELEAKIQDMLEDEEYHKARVGVGGFSEAYEVAKAKVGEEITPRQKVYLRDNKFLKEKGLDPGKLEEFRQKVEELSPEDRQELNELLKKIREKEIKERTVREIRRSVRTANDIFQITQRHAVINSRGFSKDPKENRKALEFLGQPGGAFPMYNPEAFLWLQYSIENIHDKEFVDRIKMDMALSDLKKRKKDDRGIDIKSWRKEEYEAWKKEQSGGNENIESYEEWKEARLLEYGTVLFRDLYQVADFYSSGWRIEGTLEHLKQYAGKKGFDESNFALFMRLKELGPDQELTKIIKKEKVWEKVAQFRPDIMLKILRERDVASLNPFLTELRASGIEITGEDKAKGINNEWDKFKATYGSALSTIREMGMNEDPPRRIDFTKLDLDINGIMAEHKVSGFPISQARAEEIASLNRQYKKNINDMLGDENAAQKVNEIYVKMQKFIRRSGKDNDGNELDLRKRYSKDTKYADLHTRVYEVDDIPLVKLEKDAESVGMVPLSKKLAADVRTDSLVRNFNDLGHAGNATNALLKFIKSEDIKTKLEGAIEFAEESSMYGGQKQRGKSIRFTAGTLYFLAKKDKWADVMDFDRGIGRRPISELQRIYGPQAEAIDREVLRGKLDEIRIRLADAFDAEDAEAMYHELEEMFEVRGEDLLKLKGEGAFILLLIAAILTGPTAFKEGFDMSKVEGVG